MPFGSPICGFLGYGHINFVKPNMRIAHIFSQSENLIRTLRALIPIFKYKPNMCIYFLNWVSYSDFFVQKLPPYMIIYEFKPNICIYFLNPHCVFRNYYHIRFIWKSRDPNICIHHAFFSNFQTFCLCALTETHIGRQKRSEWPILVWKLPFRSCSE